MQPNKKFIGLDLEFWANIKLLNQRLGYAVRITKKNPTPNPAFVIPKVNDIITVFNAEGLDHSKIIKNGLFTDFGDLIVEYMRYRNDVLMNAIRPNLMDQSQAKILFDDMKLNLNPQCPLPMNKQTGNKKDYPFLTGIVNMLIESHIGNITCDYDPRELTAITVNGFPLRTLSRRVDGAFPSTKNPYAIWEIKEYYYTKTFGSRVADGVYETQLDGWELWETKQNLGKDVMHYLIVDDHFTWWVKGRSYLCRLVDSMHMGLVSEVIFGREVVTRIPILVNDWVNNYKP